MPPIYREKQLKKETQKMIELKVKDGKEDKAKFIIGGNPQILLNQSVAMVTSMSQVIANNMADEETAKRFLRDFIMNVKDYYNDVYGEIARSK